jgi:hypothetical protein
MLERAAVAFDNPDYVDVVIHSYRHRLGFAAGYPPYEEIEERLTRQHRSPSQQSLWTAWRTVTSRLPMARRPQVTSPVRAFTTRCQMLGTTFRRNLQTHSPMRC